MDYCRNRDVPSLNSSNLTARICAGGRLPRKEALAQILRGARPLHRRVVANRGPLSSVVTEPRRFPPP